MEYVEITARDLELWYDRDSDRWAGVDQITVDEESLVGRD